MPGLAFRTQRYCRVINQVAIFVFLTWLDGHFLFLVLLDNSEGQSDDFGCMGHSDASVTLNVYTHASYAHAADQMAKISQIRQTSGSNRDRDSAAG